jgi:hypothetical protein
MSGTDSTYSQLPAFAKPSNYGASHTGTAFCTPWPKFSLVDFNNLGAHSVDGQTRHTYGLSDLPAANATIVAQLFADSEKSFDIAHKLVQIKTEMMDQFGLKVNAVFLNYCMPLKCAMAPCTAPNCNDDYYGGCAPDAEELKTEYWQGPIMKAFPNMAIFQDTKDKLVWRKVGGGKNDIIIYDQSGLLYDYGCSRETCIKGQPGFNSDVMTPLGYQNIKSLTHLAANTLGTQRCQAGSQCKITNLLAPDSMLANEYVDIIVIAGLVLTGMAISILIPKLWASIQAKFCSTTTIARDRFIQLSTVDDDYNEDEDGFI